MSRALSAFATAAVFGAAAATMFNYESSVVDAQSSPRSFGEADTSESPMAAYGLPSNVNLVRARGYISSLNHERRIPNWVMERIPHTKPKSKKDADSAAAGDDNGGKAAVSRTESKFYSDETVPEMFRSTNADYNKRGLSRGHLAPAQFHKNSQEEMNETFNLSANIVPQDMTMNACDWYRLESMTKKLSKEFEKGLWVVSGPLFVPILDMKSGKNMVSYEVVGTHNVAVPTHMFKCLLGVKEDNKKYLGCFVMPNEPITEEQPLTQYSVPSTYVERVAGIRIFPEASRGTGWGATAPADLCRNFECKGSYAAFSKSFRQVGRVRAATTEGQVKLVYAQLYQEGSVDAAVDRELQAKLKELGVTDAGKYQLKTTPTPSKGG
ncbi:endonuclease G, putative [Bodo saltans]|uniref:Endonuclease G, putative n=1 Tax=Bodo saltans TaxID=75058 RepID=A0A0S4JFH6_BODSA|nr:endonuclease G, putative [Bodo saltans]|eukprot:CUG87734.1 endonuclease G, putative [Bodo saltans]